MGWLCVSDESVDVGVSGPECTPRGELVPDLAHQRQGEALVYFRLRFAAVSCWRVVRASLNYAVQERGGLGASASPCIEG